ncbi:TetR/AcrR family transcriptional regulator [Phyllobacterium sp. 21LDTY02-6]|uniref:TetR/AcrR family transcriptional regulator n=1 Tax=Phyllobacterium sp. 21LDTY02-6 TaxID=2944903 RepID=UPI002020D618|nr:TetR/AcrR family transcriptional regulator [Phyllobacterium sp. 21LDTY02-6]MCO4318054.1 TetR/AcrR family transcriptional regulator [Phyllobacterium sp. 21LDTY02-6]
MAASAHEKRKAPKWRTLKGNIRQEKLFCAALCVALEQGFGHVTLASVARKAGISKGGLLHHFSTKGDLIAGMLKYYSENPKITADMTIDPLAATALIAAAESPALLSPLMDYLDGEASRANSISMSDSSQNYAERMRTLIRMLHLKPTAPL